MTTTITLDCSARQLEHLCEWTAQMLVDDVADLKEGVLDAYLRGTDSDPDEHEVAVARLALGAALHEALGRDWPYPVEDR